uniref:Mab-21 domain-containing protein n=1 Tax=Macrostomum lignano TaxID=282301 RepID=A0A1I8F3Z9_9PLAT
VSTCKRSGSSRRASRKLPLEKRQRGKQNAASGSKPTQQSDATNKLSGERSPKEPECLKNWECMPANGRELFVVHFTRAEAMKDAAKQSIYTVQSRTSANELNRLSRLIEERVDHEMLAIEECREIMRSNQLPSGYRFQGSVREVWGFQDTSDIDLVLTKKRPAWTGSHKYCARRKGKSELFRRGRRFTDASATSKVLSPGKFRKKFSDWRLANSNALLSQGKLEPGPGREFTSTGRPNRPWLLKEWVIRQTTSPLGISKRVGSAPIHIVPIGAYKGRSKQYSHTWRYSYNEIECRLIEELSPKLGAGYALLKKVCHRYLKPAGFKSYHAKTCYLWLLLQSEHEQLSLLQLVESTIELLMTCAANGFIPNYFMPSENILRETISSKQVNRAAISTYLENFAESGERITDLTVARLSSYFEQLSTDIKLTPLPSLLNWSDSCLCRFSDVPDRQYSCDSDEELALDSSSNQQCQERAKKQCANCDSLIQYELKKSAPLHLIVRFIPFFVGKN